MVIIEDDGGKRRALKKAQAPLETREYRYPEGVIAVLVGAALVIYLVARML